MTFSRTSSPLKQYLFIWFVSIHAVGVVPGRPGLFGGRWTAMQPPRNLRHFSLNAFPTALTIVEIAPRVQWKTAAYFRVLVFTVATIDLYEGLFTRTKNIQVTGFKGPTTCM